MSYSFDIPLDKANALTTVKRSESGPWAWRRFVFTINSKMDVPFSCF